MSTDPNADLIGVSWTENYITSHEEGTHTYVVTHTASWDPERVYAEREDGVTTTRPVGMVRRHKELTEGGA